MSAEPTLIKTSSAAFYSTVLDSSKAKDVKSIRLKTVQPASGVPRLYVAQLDSNGKVLTEFEFKPVMAATERGQNDDNGRVRTGQPREVKGLSISNIARVSEPGAPLSEEDQAALRQVTDELSRIKESMSVSGSEDGSDSASMDRSSWTDRFWDTAAAALACATAAAEFGANPAADIGCGIALAQWIERNRADAMSHGGGNDHHTDGGDDDHTIFDDWMEDVDDDDHPHHHVHHGHN